MNLEGVEKTMLLTLYTKAKHSQQKNHKFFDFKAIDVISEIDYDFTGRFLMIEEEPEQKSANKYSD